MDVLIRNGCKKYGNSAPVLDNLNLNVHSGSIYGILGASGSGKTTLVSCIVGLKCLDSGEIYVRGLTPGEKGSCIPGVGVGYMPQEATSLTQSFSIKETFWFYGWIYGMASKKIQHRIEFLQKFLNLPDLSKVIDALSGGQKRRVSLAIAMMHEPKLLVLDEPTVGLDPLLRQSIWEHLCELVATDNSMTIIITTHYTEEASACDVVGVMRGGRLIAENSPNVLLQVHNTIDLEATVLKLCHQNEASGYFDLRNFRAQKAVHCLPKEAIPAKGMIHRIRKHFILTSALMYRTLMLSKRYYSIIIAQIVLPLINMVLVNIILGSEPTGLSLGIVSGDWNGPRNVDITEHCATLGKNMTCLSKGVEPLCTFFNQFQLHEINWVYNAMEQDALVSVQRGDTKGFIHFPDNFSSHFMDRLLFRNYAGNDTIDNSVVSIRLDMANSLHGVLLIERLLKGYWGYLQSILESCDMSPQLAQLPIKYHPIYGSADQGWAQLMQPFLLILCAYMLTSITGMLLTIWNRLGVGDRVTVCGIKFSHIILSSFIYDSCVVLAEIAVCLLVLPNFFGFVVQGSWITLALIIYMCSLGGIFCGILTSTLVKHEMDHVVVFMFLLFLNIFSSGGIWPLEAVPWWYKIVCRTLPVSVPTEALKSVVFRGWGFSNLLIWKGLGVSLLYILVSITLGNRFYNRRKFT